MQLIEINSAATQQNSVILLHPDDNIAVARVLLSSGQRIEAGSAVVTVLNAIPAGHKMLRQCGRVASPIVIVASPYGKHLAALAFRRAIRSTATRASTPTRTLGSWSPAKKDHNRQAVRYERRSRGRAESLQARFRRTIVKIRHCPASLICVVMSRRRGPSIRRNWIFAGMPFAGQTTAVLRIIQA